MRQEGEKVILIVGACGLDRLLTVKSYPQADAKIRTTAYHEVCGGNAGNIATAMALLKDASCWRSHHHENVRVKLLTKLGDDYVATKIIQDLTSAGVDMSSPLFRRQANTTTGSSTIIVSQAEQTRTCLFTPGTCGELTLQDLQDVSDMDEIFHNVVHLHSDGRHLDVALALAREASRRGIPVSVDPEKDRHRETQDELMRLSTILFLNATQMKDYFERKTKEWQSEEANGNPHAALPKSSLDSIAEQAIQPSLYYLRWHGEEERQQKQVVITKGSQGAIRVVSMAAADSSAGTVVDASSFGFQARLQVETVGVYKDAHVVDTTGAGDAFIAGYLLYQIMTNQQNLLEGNDAVQMGAWVAGKKLGGPGAQSTLPKGDDVDRELGRTMEQVRACLHDLIGEFAGRTH